MQEIKAVISNDQSISAKITSPNKLRGDISSGGIPENYYTKKEINELTGHSLKSDYDSNSRVLTITLYNINDDVLSSTSQTLDEDQDRYISNGRYDETTHSLIFEYNDGSTPLEISLVDLFSELELAISNEAVARENADTALSGRISELEKTGLDKQDITTNSTIIQYAKSTSKQEVSQECIWYPRISPISTGHESSTYGNGYFVSTGAGGSAIYSEDGVDWDIATGVPTGNLKYICYGNDCFLIIVYSAPYSVYRAYKPDDTWEKISELQYEPKNLQYINNKFIVFCEGNKLLSSADGEKWDEQTLDMLSMAYGTSPTGKYISVGEAGKVMYSYKGTSWADAAIISVNDLKNVIFAKNIYLVNSDTEIKYSSNGGYNWTSAIINTDTCWASNYIIKKIVYGESRFYAIVASTIDNTGQIWYSSNGISWDLAASLTNFKPNTLTYGNGCYVVTGTAGNIQSLSLDITWTNDSPYLSATEYLWSRTKTYSSNGDIYYSDAHYIYIPRKVSELENDAGYITKDVNNLTYYYKKDEIDTKLDNYYTKTDSDETFVSKLPESTDEIKDDDIDNLFDL